MDRECRIGVVIVNYKTAKLTLDCVATLKDQLDRNEDRVVIVDNDSGQQDLDTIREAIAKDGLGDFVILLPLSVNGGFSAGNNAGIRSIRARYYLLTNSDTLLLPGSVKALMDALERNPEAGIASPRLEWLDGGAQVSCFRYHKPLSEMIRSTGIALFTYILKRLDVPLPPRDLPTRPEWTSFACVLVSARTIDEVGLLDDGYFMYYEDTDYCRRARRAGFDIVNWPSARVVHLQGRSSDLDDRLVARKALPDYYYHSRARYYLKFHGNLGFLLANLSWAAGRPFSLLKQVAFGKGSPVPKAEFGKIWKRGPRAIRQGARI
jgi:GT2 family glycosyltransferase